MQLKDSKRVMMVRRTQDHNKNNDNLVDQFLYQVHPQQNRINWGAICRNPIVDSFISEPCETLTSSDGFTFTPRGQRVLACLGAGGVATLLAPDVLASIKSLGPAVGCGPDTGGESSPLGQGNPLDTMLGGLFRK